MLERILAILTKLIDPGASTGSFTLTGSFPFTSAATFTSATTATTTVFSV